MFRFGLYWDNGNEQGNYYVGFGVVEHGLKPLKAANNNMILHISGSR